MHTIRRHDNIVLSGQVLQDKSYLTAASERLLDY